MSPLGPMPGAPTPPVPVEDLATVRKRARFRIQLVGGLLSVMLAATAARGLHLAVDPDERTLSIAAENRWAAVSTQGPRGDVLDAEGNVLAMSVRAPAVFADPSAMRDRKLDVDRITRQLAEVLELDPDEVARKLAGKGRYVRLISGITPEAAAELARRGLTRARGIIVEDNYRRYYPQGTLASHVVGFVDERGGITGLERWFDDQLAGDNIVAQRRVNRFGAVVEHWKRNERAVEGMRIHTTLDRTVQRATERALDAVMERNAPMSATAVVVEVATGRVLAMATAPTFNPNQLGPGDMERTRNIAVSDAIEPGSVFKPFTLAAALETGVVHPGEVIVTPKQFRIAGVPIHDDHPLPAVTTSGLIKHSSNIGAAILAERMGPDRLFAALKAFGFGDTSGIPTFGEAAGKRHPPRVGPVELATVSYGQGATATPLQLVMATAALANDGVRMRPLLVDRVVNRAGHVVAAWEPTVVRRTVSAETAGAVVRAMQTVLDDGGTGVPARIPGFTAGGKTGTAYKVKKGQYSATARYATFIGFAPAEHPELAMAIIVDEPTRGSRYGGPVAGPVFSAVMAEALPLRGLVPDLGVGADEVDPEDELASPAEPVALAWRGDTWALPDLRGRGLRDALAGLQGAGLRLRVEGSGTVAVQHPAPGEPVHPGDTVVLAFQ